MTDEVSREELVRRIQKLERELKIKQKKEQKLKTLAFKDELTGLYNRRGFFEMATKELQIAKRNGKYVFIAYGDIDNLKPINDQYGHPAGDNAIIDAAQAYRNVFRESDVLARIGGDEIVAFGIEEKKISEEDISSRLKEAIKNYTPEEERVHSLSISVGVRRYDAGKHKDLVKMLEQADDRLYRRKNQKKKEK